MQFPTLLEYDTEVMNLEHSVTDPRFRGGKPMQRTLGRIVAYSGGFSRVYPIEVNGRVVALRCWIADIGKQKERYAAVAAHLRDHALSYFVEFDYIGNGISVNGRSYPAVYMSWVNGLPLSEYIDDNVAQPKKLDRVTEEFVDMVKQLHVAGMAHGDLQDGNILVVENGNGATLKLIDYDTMFVPALKGWKNDVVSIPDYQHPRREHEQYITEKYDYFSELVIYLSLFALSAKSDLWRSGTERKLLFTKADYEAPERSELLHAVAGLSPEHRRLVGQLIEFCHAETIQVLEPLEVVLGEQVARPRATHTHTLDGFFGAARTEPPIEVAVHAGKSGGPGALHQFFDTRPVPTASPMEVSSPAPTTQPKSGWRWVQRAAIWGMIGYIAMIMLSQC